MKNPTIALFFALFPTLLSAQPAIQWQKCLGGSQFEEAFSIVQTSDQGYITVGYSISEDGDVLDSRGGSDFWVVKMDSTGYVEWKKSYGGSDVDWAFDIKQTTDNGYVVAGLTASNDGDVSGNHGDYDMWVIKLDILGNIQWQKCLGGSGWEEAWAIEQTQDDGYILAGRTSSTDGDVTGFHGYLDYWVVKLDSNGTIEWQRAFGGSGLDIGYAVAQTNDGGYVVNGESESQDGDIKNPKGNADFWVLKLNFEGKIEWEHSLGGISYDRGNDIIQTREGGYIAFGEVRSTNGDVTNNHGLFDCWAVKLNATGEIEWQRALGGSGEDWGRAVQQDFDGNYTLVGFVYSTDGDVTGHLGGVDAWIVKLSESGSLLWQKTLGGNGPEHGYCLDKTSDGGYIFSGDARVDNGDVSGNHGQSDFWVVKLAPETSPTAMPHTRPLDVYPNPASQSLTLRLPTEETQFQVRITDATGRHFGHSNIQNGENLEIAHLPNGFYLTTATTVDGTIFVGRFFKQE